MDLNQEKTHVNDIYKFPTAKLPGRYNLSKAVLYKRLNALNIKPFKSGKSSYITQRELQLMDDLHTHCKTGGNKEKFVQQCTQGRINPTQTEAIATQAQIHEMTAPQPQEVMIPEEVLIAPETDAQEEVEQLAKDKEKRVNAEDLQKVDKKSQYRAAAKETGGETLTLYYEATHDFTIPGLKEQVKQHQERCSQARSKQTMANDLNDFLSQRLLGTKAASNNG